MSEGNGELAKVIVFPKVMHRGKYTVYEKNDGTIRIQYRREDKDEDDFMEIPGFILAMAKAAEEGKLSPMQMMAEMSKYMRGKK